MKGHGLNNLLTLAGIMGALPPLVAGHGYMVEPPSRMSAWKVLSDYKVEPINYNHMEIYCGGRDVQWNINGGKCGVCGDRWDSNPRDHELPDGRFVFARPPVNKVYAEGQVIQVALVITAPHWGDFVFRLCKRDFLSTPDATEECLNQTLLLVDGCRDRYSSASLSSSCKGLYRINVKLPEGLTCERCLFQWKYNTGHNSVTTSPEEFYACADIVIRRNVTVTPAPSLEGFQAREGVPSCNLNELSPCRTGGTAASTALSKSVSTRASSAATSTTRTTTPTSPTTKTTASTPRLTTPKAVTFKQPSSAPQPLTAAATTITTTTTATSPLSSRTSTGEWGEALRQRCESRTTPCAEFCSRSSMKLYCYFLSSCSGCYEYFLDNGLMRT